MTVMAAIRARDRTSSPTTIPPAPDRDYRTDGFHHADAGIRGSPGIALHVRTKTVYGNAYGNAMGTKAVCRRSVVEFSGGNGAPGEIRTPDPQIRSLVRTVEIIEVRYRKKLVGRVST